MLIKQVINERKNILEDAKILSNSGVFSIVIECVVENLADKIANNCLKDRRILKIEIMVEKLEPFKEAESVGIKIIRMNR